MLAWTAPNFPAMLRAFPALLLLLVLLRAAAQPDGQESAALSFTHTFGVPLARAQMFDAAMLSWERTFGLEPAAVLGRNDRASGVIEGTARINYRSGPLTAREETMGVIAYRVMVQAGNGECTVLVTHLVHSGNRGAMRGGLDFGLLTGASVPAGGHPGVSHRNAARLMDDMRMQATDRITALFNAFGSVLRQAAGP